MTKTKTTRVAPGITKRTGPNGTSYFVQIRIRGHQDVHATFGRLTDAKRYREKTIADIRAGRHGAASESARHTFGEVIDRYLSEVDIPNGQAGCLLWWSDQLADRTLASITPTDIAKLRDTLKSGTTKSKRQRAPATVNRYLAYLSIVYTRAIREWRITDVNPVKQVSKLKEPRGRVRFLKDDERDALLDACKSSDEAHLYSLVVLALTSGARAGELTGLDWIDIDFDRGTAILHDTKNGERRTIPVRGHALDLLKARRGIGPVFISKAGTAPFPYNKPFVAAVEAAGIENFRFHDLRHCAASAMAQNGASPMQIAELLGHKTLAMVKRYSHLTTENVTDAGDFLSERMFGK